MANKTFISVSNSDIFNEIKEIRKTCTNIEKHAIKTNGSVINNKSSIGINRKLIFTLIGAILGVIGWLITIII